MIRLLDDGSVAVVVWNGGEILPRIERTASIDPLPDTGGRDIRVTSQAQRRMNYRSAKRRKMFREVQRRAARNRAACPEWMR